MFFGVVLYRLSCEGSKRIFLDTDQLYQHTGDQDQTIVYEQHGKSKIYFCDWTKLTIWQAIQKRTTARKPVASLFRNNLEK